MLQGLEKQNRRSIRLKGFNYSRNGAYFVTLCTKERESLFGKILEGEMVTNDAGQVIRTVWNDLPEHYPHVELDQFIVMPNHIHGILLLVGAGLKPALDKVNDANVQNRFGLKPNWAGLKPAPTGKRHGLSEVIRGLKTFSARQINRERNMPGRPVWQRTYYDRIIRNETELNRIREYIINNPLKWHLDRDNPTGMPDDREKRFWKDFS